MWVLYIWKPELQTQRSISPSLPKSNSFSPTVLQTSVATSAAGGERAVRERLSLKPFSHKGCVNLKKAESSSTKGTCSQAEGTGNTLLGRVLVPDGIIQGGVARVLQRI